MYMQFITDLYCVDISIKFNQSRYNNSEKEQPVLILSKPSPCDIIVHVSSVNSVRKGKL